MPLTSSEIEILETAWEILDKVRTQSDFNETHDLTIPDGCRVLSDFLDYYQEQNRQKSLQEKRKLPTSVHFARFEAFNNQ